MAIRDILHFPDPRLRTIAKPVVQVDDAIRQLIDDMLDTMYAAPGIGLAATQINVHQRVIVIDVSDDKTEPLCLINPEIIESQGVEETEEGCLSVPGQYDVVQRADTVTISYLDRNGDQQSLTTNDLLAVCIQHEIDHLNGKLFVDYLSPLKRNRIRKKLEKLERKGELPQPDKTHLAV